MSASTYEGAPGAGEMSASTHEGAPDASETSASTHEGAPDASEWADAVVVDDDGEPIVNQARRTSDTPGGELIDRLRGVCTRLRVRSGARKRRLPAASEGQMEAGVEGAEEENAASGEASHSGDRMVPAWRRHAVSSSTACEHGQQVQGLRRRQYLRARAGALRVQGLRRQRCV